MRAFRLLPSLLLLFSLLAAAMAANPPQAPAKQSFRIHVDADTEIIREVDAFEVVKTGEGYAVLKLVPFPREVERSLLQLGERKKFGEVPIPGEAIWLAYAAGSNLAVVRLATTLSESEIPPGTAVLSVRPDPKAVGPVDGAIEGASALKKLGYPQDAEALLSAFAANSEYKDSRCRILRALFDLQTPETPEQGEALPAAGEKTLRTLLAECSGVEGDAAAQRLVRWTLDRLKALQEKDAAFGEQKTLVRDTLGMLSGRPVGDALLLALARIHEREGDAEEGSKVVEELFKRYPSSPLKDQARALQEALARRAPARGYRSLGAIGSGRATSSLGLREVSDLSFDPQGRLLVLDGRSKPRKLLVLEVKAAQRALEEAAAITMSEKWDPIAVAAGTDGVYYMLETDEDQLVGVTESNKPGTEKAFPTRGDAWKLRSPRRLCVIDAREILVLDPSSEMIYRFGIDPADLTGLHNLKSLKMEDTLDVASAPDGMAALATRDSFAVFHPTQGPKTLRRAMRGGTFQLEVDRIAMCRWKYVYLFDRRALRLEKFRRGGEWLTTVIDCEKEGILGPGPWAVSPEGDVVMYDEKTGQLFLFAQ